MSVSEIICRQLPGTSSCFVQNEGIVFSYKMHTEMVLLLWTPPVQTSPLPTLDIAGGPHNWGP